VDVICYTMIKCSSTNYIIFFIVMDLIILNDVSYISKVDLLYNFPFLICVLFLEEQKGHKHILSHQHPF
jgi:hypothetical protein